jgi:hypothetical protein
MRWLLRQRRSKGGRGGKAQVDGENSSAKGGKGGDGVVGDGGDGGDAGVDANNSYAIGGDGGRGGVGDGGKGGDAYVGPDDVSFQKWLRSRNGVEEDAPVIRPSDTYISINGEVLLLAGGGNGPNGGDSFGYGQNAGATGGQGGEADQPDGRGGRGGRLILPPEIREAWGLGPDRGHMKWPYFEPITEPGRGEDRPDTPQYMARRLIVERLKARYLARNNLTVDSVWYDRQVVPLDWLNSELLADGHQWAASIVDLEYQFTNRSPARD